MGDQLEHGDNICGAVFSIRHNEDLVSVWNRDASDQRVSIYLSKDNICDMLKSSNFNFNLLFPFCQVVIALGDAIKRHLKLPHSYVMEYKPHDASLRDNSSYRNTWLRG